MLPDLAEPAHVSLHQTAYAAVSRRWHKHVGAWLAAGGPRLGDWHFWAVQLLVAVVALVHSSVEWLRFPVSETGVGQVLYFVPTALFVVPVIYAALNFGLMGAIPTAVWCTVVTMPNVFLFHQDLARVGVIWQLSLVNFIAFFAGQRFDKELALRRRAETATAASAAAEARWRALFTANPVANLIVDVTGVVQQANPAAAVLFRSDPLHLRGTSLAGLVGAEQAAKILKATAKKSHAPHIVLAGGDGTEIHLAATVGEVEAAVGERAIQVLLSDVTTERRQEDALRVYAANLIDAQEAERRRIARDLHDETVQRLIQVCQQVDLITEHGALIGLGAIRRSVEQAVDELRNFARDLRPPVLDDLGIVPAIRRLLAEAIPVSTLVVDLNVAGEPRRLTPDAELALFRIAQQAIRNVEQHARATRLCVRVSFMHRDVRLQVLDDGQGFALPVDLGLAVGTHLGLLGMRERAHSVGGNLEIDSRPGVGTCVSVVIPDHVR